MSAGLQYTVGHYLRTKLKYMLLCKNYHVLFFMPMLNKQAIELQFKFFLSLLQIKKKVFFLVGFGGERLFGVWFGVFSFYPFNIALEHQ